MNRFGVMSRGIAVAAALVLLAGACSSSGVDSQTEAARATGTVSLDKKCTQALCGGTRDGAAIKIQLPTKDWNGTLIIWSHGYRPVAPVPANPLNPTVLTPVDRSAADAPSAEVADALLADGFALAGSAFSTNGWDTREGVRADQRLYDYFSSTFGTPKRVYIWGASLGGLITETLAETNPDWVSGVAPLCGVLGGTNLNLDLALDVAYAVKTLIYPPLQLTGYASFSDAIGQWEGATRALVAAAQKGEVADLFAIAAIAGAPAKTDMFDGSTITSKVSAIVQSLVQALGYGTWGRYDVEQRVGGNPSQNTGVDYTARIGTDVQPLLGDKYASITKALADGERVSADKAARAKANSLGNPTGAIMQPTITLHTEDDPLVLVQNENVFAARAAAHARDGQLVQLFSGPPTTYSAAPYGAGHCNFTKEELLGVVHLLDNWVRYGVYAGTGAVADALDYSVNNSSKAKNTPATVAAGTATTGYDPNYAPPPWPTETSQ
jgi:pimeloyl-ACP methyl ester carboxylesterase